MSNLYASPGIKSAIGNPPTVFITNLILTSKQL